MKIIMKALASMIVVSLAVTITIFWLGNYRALGSISNPVRYVGDAPAVYALRGLDLGRRDYEPRTGAPFNFPTNHIADSAKCYLFSMECSILRIAGHVTSDPVKIVNFYYFLTYYICALLALYALRKIGFSWATSSSGAVIYSLLPYHFIRNVNHLSVSNYALVPIFVLLCIWVYENVRVRQRQYGPPDTPCGEPTFNVGTGWKAMAAPLLVAIFWAGTNNYYAFMFLLFLSFSAFLAHSTFRTIAGIKYSITVIGAVLLTFIARKALEIASWGQHAGIKFGAFQMTGYGQDELYPLKLMQMILPVPGHRLEIMRKATAIYSSSHPLVNENASNALGMALAVSMLALLALAFFASPRQSERTRFLSRCLLFGLFLGAMGGLGALFSESSWLIFGSHFPLSQARAWNRVYVFVAFIALLFLLSGIEKLLDRAWKTPSGPGVRILGRRIIILTALGLFVTAAIADQVPRPQTRQLERGKQRYSADKAFFAELDSHYNRSYRVFEWPAMIPWGGKYGQVYYTDAYRPLVASNRIIVSFGAAPGTTATKWLASTASQPPAGLVSRICATGFDGVLVFRLAMRHEDRDLVGYLQDHLTPLEESSEYMYFDVAPLCTAQKAPAVAQG